MEQRAKIEARIRALEGGHQHKISGTARKSAQFDKYENKSEVLQYKEAADSSIPSGSKKRKITEGEEATSEKKKKKRKSESEVEMKEEVDEPVEKKKKKKKSKVTNGDASDDE
jgi:nucleolar protein 58